MRKPTENEIREAIRELRAIVVAGRALQAAIAVGMAADALAWTLGEPTLEVDGARAPPFAELIADLRAVGSNRSSGFWGENSWRG